MAGFIGAGALTVVTTGSTVGPGSHASTQVGDILFCQLINKSVTANVTTPPDGTWTKLIEGINNATTAGHRHQYTLYWKRATVAGAQTYTFTKATGEALLFAGVISTFRTIGGGGLDPTAVGTSVQTTASVNVTFPAFDPVGVGHVLFFAYYGLNLTTFAAMAGTNPTCTNRYDLESASGTTCSLACTSGDSDPANIASRTWGSAATGAAGNTGVVIALSDAGSSNPPTQPLARRLVVQAGGVSGPVLAPSTDVNPVAKATVAVTGKTVTVLDFETTAVSKASIVVTGQTVTIPADSVPSSPGSGDVLFASSRTRLNVRRGLLYRSLTVPVRVAVTADTVSVTPATVTVIGQTVAIGDSTQSGNNDVLYASTRTRLNVRRGLLYRSLTAPVLPEIVAPPLQPDILFPSQEQTIFGRWTLLYRPLTVPGRPPAVTDTVPITKGQISLTGKTVTVRELDIIPVNKATVVFGGQTVALVDPGVDRITVEKADVWFTGQTVTVTDTGVQPPVTLPPGGGGVWVPPWLDYGRKKRRRYRALEEIEARLEKRIEALKAETKQTQEKVAEVMFQAGQTGEFVPFNLLLIEQTRITALLLDTQRRAERVRQEKIELARLAQIAAFEADEEEAIMMLLLT